MRTLTLMALLLALALVTGCGGDDEDSGDSGGAATQTETEASGGATAEEEPAGGGGGGEGTTLRIAADAGGALAFDKDALSAPAGTVTIVMDNPSDIPHAVEIEGDGEESVGDTVTKGGVSRASLALQPGKYRYYCPVGNHASAGMEGTLTVK